MKTIFTLLTIGVFSLLSLKSSAQFTQDFEGSFTSLSGGCWRFVAMNHSSDGQVAPITGTGSLYSNPPTSGSSTRDIATPYLNINSTSFTVSFNYKLSNKIAGNATRTIEVGLENVSGVFTSLSVITMDKNTATTTLNFSQTFTLASTGVQRLVIRLGGSTGDGNTRIIFDDLYTSANAYYNNAGSHCNESPVAVNDIFNGSTGLPYSGNVKTNDSDPNGELINSAIVVTSPDGTVVLNADGSFTFTPNPGFVGVSTTFTYQLTDNGFDPAVSNIATVTINFSSAAPLPVKLISFTAQLASNNKVDLKWSTSTEINASHFVIEKSVDGKNFSEAGVVFAAGNSTSVNKYQYTDNVSSDKTIIYYRLRTVDADGKFEYSATRIIRIGKQTENTITILAYPNPVTTELRITVPANWQGKKATYELINANGQVSKKVNAASASQTETLDMSNIAPGFYLIKVSCDNETATQKIVKK